ncbi:MAG: deoxyguanosinetriphosphate triphosphohydrolase [Deltaproteobacteria bacterium]
MTIRERLEADEERTLHPRAARAARTRGRERPEPEDELRTAFQRDRDRVIHCKSFRRLKGKTQVFLAPVGDHYRTRLTHTLEVSQVARTIARALALNESLVEAMCMGHDLGHTPFGHAGESVLRKILPDGFHHVRQSVRVVEVLEREGAGLNLTLEVRDGILRHTKGKGAVLMQGAGQKALTLEAEVVRIADIVAYVCHDLDDAIRAGLLTEADVPEAIVRVLGKSHGQRLDALVRDVVFHNDLERAEHIEMSGEIHGALLALRDFLYERVYESQAVHSEFVKAEKLLSDLHCYCLEDPERFHRELWPTRREGDSLEREVVDFLCGMTDRYAIETYERLFVPRPWSRH